MNWVALVRKLGMDGAKMDAPMDVECSYLEMRSTEVVFRRGRKAWGWSNDRPVLLLKQWWSVP